MADESGGPDRTPNTIWNEVGQHAGWGLTIAAAMGFFLFLGYQLDVRIGTLPLFTVVGALVGAGGGFYSMIRHLLGDAADRGGPPAADRDEERP